MTDQLKQLQQKANVRNLVSGTPDQWSTMEEGLQNIPISQIMQQAQHLENVLLPQALAKFGEKHESYKFYERLLNSLIWCMMILDRHDRLKYNYSNTVMLTEFWQKKATFYEQELLKYTTAEDLLYGETYKMMAGVIGKRAEEMITKKTNV